MKDYYEIFLELFNIKHPKIVLPLLFTMITGSIAYDTKTFYDVFKYYPTTDNQFHKIDGGWLYVNSPAKKVDLKEQTVSYSLSDNHFRIDLGYPKSLFLGKIDIPANSILGCSTNGSTFILKETQKKMRINNIDLREWCWQNKIAVFNGEEIGDWFYNNKPLPNPKSISDRLSLKESYYHEIGQRCSR